MVHDFVRSAVHAALAGEARVADAVDGGAPWPRDSAHGRDQPPPASDRGPDAADPQVLAVLPDGLVVARAGDRLLLARGADLCRVRARLALEAAAAGGRATARPLLIPERIPCPGGPPEDPALAALACLGFEIRASATDGMLLLAVPEVLAGASLTALGEALRTPPAGGHEAHAWVAPLAGLAGGIPLDEGAAAAILRTLHGAGLAQPPWAALDACALAALLPSGG